MLTRKLMFPVALVACLACVAIADKPEAADPPAEQKTEKSTEGGKQDPLEVFMRKKLDASSKVLEGLCMEDATLIEEGANELTAMSKVEIWNVLTDADYREHSREFRDNAARVSEAAKEGDFDKAALRWFDVTMSCLECHDHVRGEEKKDKK